LGRKKRRRKGKRRGITAAADVFNHLCLSLEFALFLFDLHTKITRHWEDHYMI
jgi:hypothetical protein